MKIGNYMLPSNFWYYVAVVGVVFLGGFYPNQIDWSVDRSQEYTVQVYPNSENVKSYELPVDMDITEHRHGWRHNYYEYNISRVTFPNEGYLEFTDCNVIGTKLANCTDQDNETWGIKVLVTPDKPENDYSSD